MTNVKIVTESKDSFYVHLLSNVQPELFNNKANHFTTQFENSLVFPSEENWEVALKEYHYVNNIDTITRDLTVEVGRLASKGETWKSNLENKVLHDAEKVDYPFYFTECGSHLTMYKPFQDVLSKDNRKQQSNLMNVFLNFLQQQRLLGVLRFVICDGGGSGGNEKAKARWYQLKLRNTTSSVDRLYFPSKYALCMSYPLALLLRASTQCIRSEKENLNQENGMWTQNEHSWLGNEAHFKTITLRQTSVEPMRNLASNLFDVLRKRLKIHGKITNTVFRQRVQCIQSFLEECESARAEDYTFTMLPFHRNKKQIIKLKTANLTYVELFRHLEEMGYGSLCITPDQSSLTFTMHDLSQSNLFAVELPTSAFVRHNKHTNNFYPPQVRVDKWEFESEKKQFVRRHDVALENAFSTIELNYSDEKTLSGITTVALETELVKNLADDKEVPDAQAWVNRVYGEIMKLKSDIKGASKTFLRGRCPGNSNIMAKNETFLLTSKMQITMALDLQYRRTFTSTEMTQVKNQSVYTPYDYTLYDVKLPYSPETINVCSYTQSLDIGRYDIKKDATTFQDVYTKYNTITVEKGFYTPLSLIRSLQSEFDKYQYACNFSLVNKTGDDNGQGFLKIENNNETYLQFNPIAQELFHLPEPFLSPNSSFITTTPFDLQPSSFTNIIYCNVVGECPVGSQREKILNISPVRHSDYKYGQWVGKEFASADYYPLAMKTVQRIEIQFRGDTGDFIPISQGRSYVKLHFQRREAK